MKRDERRPERARGIHGRAANRPREHRRQGNDRTSHNSSRNSLFSRAGGDPEDDEHQERSQEELEQE